MKGGNGMNGGEGSKGAKGIPGDDGNEGKIGAKGDKGEEGKCDAQVWGLDFNFCVLITRSVVLIYLTNRRVCLKLAVSNS